MTTHNLHVILGTGPLGQAVARDLLRRGERVRMVNRIGQAAMAAPVETVRGDVNDPSSVHAVTKDAAVVYQCAQPAYTAWTTQFPPMQRSIIEGVARSGATLVVAENLYMYGLVSGPMREDTPFAATTRKGRVRAEMAEAVQAAHRAGTLRTTSGRGADFFGPGVRNSALGERVFAAALKGKTASTMGNLDLPHSYTFIDDFGAALVTLGQNEAALGRAWHVPNAPAMTTREVLNLLFTALGTPPRMSGMGKLMLQLGGLFIPEARESVEMLYEFEHPFIVDSSAFERTFAQRATPLPVAIDATLHWYRSQTLAAAPASPA